MKATLIPCLTALAGYCLVSQSLAWLLIFQYTVHGHSDLALGLIAASGASGLAFAQLINDRILFRMGPYRMYTACCLTIAALLLHLSTLQMDFKFDLFARFLIGWSDGMVFLILESWILFFASSEDRAASLAWYLAVLYGAQMMSPLLAQAHLDHSSLIVAGSLLSLGIASLPIQRLHSFMDHQEAPTGWPVFAEWNLIKIGGIGSALCALSGALLPSWTAFLPKVLLEHGIIKSHVQFFLLGGIIGQYLIIWTASRWNVREQIHWMTLNGLFAIGIMFLCFETPLNQYHHSPLLGMFLLGITSYCLYGLGMAKAIENVAPEYLLRANKTFLTCYTIPAIFSPALFGLIPGLHLRFLSLMGLSAIGFFVIQFINAKKMQKI